MQQMVKDYKDYEADVTRVRTHATQGTDPELTRVAANLLSTLETPLTMARTLVQQPR